MKLLKTLSLALAFAILGAKTCKAIDSPQSQTIGPFGGLNTNQAPEAIGAKESPDLLNVDISNGGSSVKKRQGFGTDATLTISTSAVHNTYKFFDSSGNEVRLAFNDVKVNASVNGAAWSVILTTGITIGATWDCTDYLGFAYCVSSSFDCPIKTNGTSAGTTGVCGTNGVPAGSLVTNSGDRLLVGATSANPSRIAYSQSTVFTNFALGVQPSDSSYEDILAPGSKLTHLAYRFGRWLWWKDQSFGFLVGTGQFDLNLVVVSHTIGTLDNTDIFDGNLVYFRGSDAQIYTYDGFTLSRAISTDIFPTLNTANRRKANLWLQTSASDFGNGTSVPSKNISYPISPGDITVSSYTVTENSNTQWNSGFASNLQVNASSLVLSTNTADLSNNSFESGQTTNWSVTGAAISNTGSFSATCGTISPQNGSFFEGRGGTSFMSIQLIDANTSAMLSSTTVTYGTECAWALQTFTPSTAYVRKLVKLTFDDTGGNVLTSDAFVYNGNPIQVYFNFGHTTGPSVNNVFWDNVSNTPKSTIASGAFTSQLFDTGFTSSTVSLTNFAWIANTSTPTFSVQTSSTNVAPTWTTLLTSSQTNAVAHRYVRYVSTLTITASDNALTQITTATIVARSTGTYYSAVNNAPLLTSFNTLGLTDTVPGASTITYYTRASTYPYTVLGSSPTWTLQPKNATVTASSGTYMQFRADFAITAATESPTVSDFTFNWFEGTAADKMYGTYFSNAIWFSLSLGTSTTTNNRIFRYDLLSQCWTLYDIPANGFLTYNNGLYFGSTTAGKVFQFGNSVYSDNGTAINAYWKSKPFFGDSPFTDKDLKTASWYVSKDSGTTLTMNYYINETTTTVTKSINLYSSANNFIRSNYNFPAGTSAGLFSAQFGDNSTNPPWEVFGGLITFTPRAWIPTQ